MFFEDAMLDAVAKGGLLSALGLVWIIFLVRIVGLRSFSKMTNFDFVMTVAMGSLLAGASQSQSWPALVQTMVAAMGLFAVQFAMSSLRQRAPEFDAFVQNTPMLLMKDGVILHSALQAARVSEDDLIAKLRSANVRQLSAVRAAILETTGDVSVLHGPALDRELLQGVGRA
ncbi:MAG: DUF421 domain-containing protein [Sulfitobacter sp.]